MNRKITKGLSLLLVICMFLNIFLLPVSATTSVPSDIYLTQVGSNTCTLSSAAMMLRARTYLSNNSNWSSITENGIKSVAWSGGLKWSWTYSIGDCSLSVSHKSVSGMTISVLKSLLNSHPEGIVIHVNSLPHAVFLTDYEGDTFYCADPLSGYSGKRITLSSSYLGKKLGSQSTVLNKITAYWYVSSYSIPSNMSQFPNENLSSLVPVDLGTNFTAPILNKNYWKPLENSYTESDKPPVRIADETGYANQLWYFVRQSDGTYKISSCYDGKYLDVRDASTEVYTVIQTCEDSGSDAQKWYIYEYAGGYAIRSKLCAQVMDLKNNDATSGNNVQLYPWNESAAQIWSIYRGEECVLKGPTLSVSAGDSKTTTKFIWEDVYGARDYVLKIWKGEAWDGDAYHEAYANSGYELSLPAGTYQVYVDACHEYDYEMSNLVTFTVNEHKCTNTTKVTSPTCAAQGYTTYTCTVCGNSYKGNYINALGHKYSYKVTIAPTVSSTGKLTGTCSRCSGTQVVTLPKLNTTDYTYKIVNTATCTADGKGRYTWNITSYGNYYFDVVISKRGHSYRTEVIAPGCTKGGNTVYTCSVCGESYVDNETEALGHKLGEWSTTKEATCTGAGSEKRSCERCGYYETKEVAATGHAYEEVVTEPTCEETGYTTHTCSVCGDSYIDSETEALGHEHGEWGTTKEASCEEAGEEKRNCERCEYFETQEVSATGHIYETVVTAPTCEETGYTTHTCSRCGDSYVDGEVEALGHKLGEWATTKEASCEEVGEEKRSCERCDATDTIPDPSTPVVPEVPENGKVIRLSGATRYETGYKVADVLKERLGVEQFDAVVIATGKNFADALSGSYLAVVKNAPIILTNGKDDNIATLHDYIRESVAEDGKVYILGGEGAVPASVEAIEGYDVVRLSGPTRYDINLAILEEAGIAGDELIVATGKSFADSLSASAAKLPILLVKPGTALSDEAKVVIEGMNNIYIIGGEGAVSKAIEEELAVYSEVERVFGKSRYETSVAVANTFFEDVEEVVVASGKNFPDGLCGGPLAAAMDAPLILTADGKTDTAVDYVQGESVESGFVLGGTGAIGDDSVVEILGLESADEIILK